MTQETSAPLVSVIMGSDSDSGTMKLAADTLKELSIPYEALIVSAHRTPDRLELYAKRVAERGIRVVIAGAGGAAHLPGMVASHTHLPVIGVPIRSSALSGVDSMLSILQMPGGIPVATMAIGDAGAKNAALYAARILALADRELEVRLRDWIRGQTNRVPEVPSFAKSFAKKKEG